MEWTQSTPATFRGRPRKTVATNPAVAGRQSRKIAISNCNHTIFAPNSVVAQPLPKVCHTMKNQTSTANLNPNAAVSPARADTDHVGVELLITSPATIPLRREAEYALIPLNGPITLDGVTLGVGELAYLAPGRDEVHLSPDLAGRALLVGGSPFEYEPLMWWNFVARTRDEISRAFVEWEAGDPRFGPVASKLDRVTTTAPMWLDRG